MKLFNSIFQRKNFLIRSICIIFPCLPGTAFAQTMTISGSDWTVNLTPVTEAGMDYSPSTYQSDPTQIQLTVSVPLLLGSGRVSAHYQPNPKWDPALKLAIKRTNDGTTLCVLCTITGGKDSFLALSQTDIDIFKIQAVLALAAYNNIGLQLQLSGVSVTIPAAAYNSRIMFTVSSP